MPEECPLRFMGPHAEVKQQIVCVIKELFKLFGKGKNTITASWLLVMR